MIIWTPRKNTEREAIRRHGAAWHLVQRVGDKLLINSCETWLDGDLRWIGRDQVVTEDA